MSRDKVHRARLNINADGSHDFDGDQRDHLDPSNPFSELARLCWNKAPRRSGRRSRPVMFDAMQPVARATSQAKAARLTLDLHRDAKHTRYCVGVGARGAA